MFVLIDPLRIFQTFFGLLELFDLVCSILLSFFGFLRLFCSFGILFVFSGLVWPSAPLWPIWAILAFFLAHLGSLGSLDQFDHIFLLDRVGVLDQMK